MSVSYHIRWRVPVTIGDGQVYVTADASLRLSASSIAAEAVKRLKSLAKACPAGGIMPAPMDGEQWALTPRDRDRPLLAGSAQVPQGAYDLVLLDAHGAPYDPSELVRVR